jgi:hypothetical protein
MTRGFRSTGVWLIALLWLATPTLASAQAAPLRAGSHVVTGTPGADVGDVPSGPATLRGRVVHDSDPSAAGGVALVLYALGADGTPGLRGQVSSEDGSFAFENLSNDPDTVYLIGARYGEVPFGVRVSFEAGQRSKSVEVAIAESTVDGSGAGVGDVLIRVDRGCSGLLVRESHELHNTGSQVIYVPHPERAGREPILRIALPKDAANLESVDGDHLDRQGDSIAYWGPLRPGVEEFEFGYALPGGDGGTRVRREFPTGSSRVRVFGRQTAPPVRPLDSSDVPLVPGESVELETIHYAVLEARNIAAGDGVEFAVAEGAAIETDPRLTVLESRIWLDADGAAMSVDEQHQFSVIGDAPLTSATGAPLFCLDVGSGAQDLQFSTESLRLGLSHDPSGAIGVSGPIPAGESRFALRYRIALDDESIAFERSLPFEVPLLSLLIADNGWVVETDRLHRRRPARTSDRTYLHLEGFGIAAGTPVAVHLEPLDTRSPPTSLASSGFAFAAGLLTIAFLTLPLRRTEDAAAESAPNPIEEERQSVLAALRSLDDDFDTGKVSDQDYEQLRLELRASAVELMRKQRASEPRETTEPAAGNACGTCGSVVDPQARFCSQCGARVNEA